MSNSPFYIVIDTRTNEVIYAANTREECADHIHDAVDDDIHDSEWWAVKEAYYADKVKPGFRRIVADFNQESYEALERATNISGLDAGTVLCRGLAYFDYVHNPTSTNIPLISNQ